MRACEAAFLPDRATVHRPIETVNIAGATTTTDSTPYVGIPCEATPRVLRQLIEHIGGGRIESAVRWNVTMPYGTDILLNDVIHVTPAGLTSVMILEVNGLLSDESWETAVTAECMRVQ